MEKVARTRFRVIRVNRWSVAFILLALLTLLLLPSMQLHGADSAPASAVRQGVTLLGRDFSGMSEQEALALLEEMAGRVKAAPVIARESRGADGNSYVVPELNGYTMDVQTTWFRLATAAEGTDVVPATKPLPPSRKATDYPLSAIRQGNAGKKAVALLINVDWGEMELARMRPVLQRHGIKVTFFVSGQWANRNKQLLKFMAADGHEIATHGYNLSTGPKALAAAGTLKSDIKQSVETIQQITGLPVRYYAPHMSELSPEILRAAADLKLRTVLYSLDTIDWRKDSSPELILGRLQKAMTGDLVLMHPMPNTVQVLDQALTEFHRRGLRMITLSEMLSADSGEPSSAATEPRE